MRKIFLSVFCLLLVAVFVSCDISGYLPSHGESEPSSIQETVPAFGEVTEAASAERETGSDRPVDTPSEYNTDHTSEAPTETSSEGPTEGMSGSDTDIVPDDGNDDFYSKYSEEEKQLYYTLWKEDSSVQIKIDITPYELQKINEAYADYMSSGKGDAAKAETYRRCDLTIIVNGEAYYFDEVGIRMRGNTSRRDFCNNDGIMYDLVHMRFSFDETFDGEEYASGAWAGELYHDWSGDAAGRAARKNRSFATMEKMYFKWNKNYDNTYIREIYANRMFRAYGIAAPNITLSELSIMQNGKFESMGVVSIYETIDKAFIKRNFGDASGGDLYKCTYRNSRADLSYIGNYGVETPTQTFTYALKTNNDRNAPDYHHNQHLKDLINAITADKNSASFKEDLERVIDMDYFAGFEAVNYLLGNPDCIRNNYNNYYLYFTPEGKGYFIPYDYDRCLGITRDWNPDGTGMTEKKPYSIKDISNSDISNPLYRKTILDGGVAEYKALYVEKLSDVLGGKWFTYENFHAMYESYKKTYEKSCRPSEVIVNNCGGNIDASRFVFSDDGADSFSDSSNNISVEDYMQKKRETAALG